ncbi:MAG: DUF1987 domain-containing protein [Bacteroidia bacterium]|nr:DUF1987 domain-containing protein [Bacteroidia bacterium]
MEKFVKEGTYRTPTVTCDGDIGLIDIRGKSTPENTYSFYQPLAEWIIVYINNPVKETTVNIELEYVNTSSSKWLYSIFKELTKLNKNDMKLTINWYHSDEDIEEVGKDLGSMLNLPMNYIEIPE